MEVSHANKPVRFPESRGKVIDVHCARKGTDTSGTRAMSGAASKCRAGYQTPKGLS